MAGSPMTSRFITSRHRTLLGLWVLNVMIPNNRVLWANPTGDIIYSVKCSIPAIWFAETWTLAHGHSRHSRLGTTRISIPKRAMQNR